MEGVDYGFKVDYGSKKYHSSLSIAKRYCSKTNNCFGIWEYYDADYSIGFPIELRQHGSGKIHKKEHIIGNFH